MELTVQKRMGLGGKATRALTKEGLVAGELYGNSIDNVHLAIPRRDLMKIARQRSGGFISLILDGKKIPTLLKAIQKDPVSNDVIHVDFLQIKLDQTVKTKVSIVFVGEAPAVKEKSGILIKAINEIETESLPNDIPTSLEVSLTPLNEIGKSLFVKDIIPPKGVKLLFSPDAVIATIVEQKEEEVAAPTVTVEDVKVETEEKKQERDTKKQEEASPKE